MRVLLEVTADRYEFPLIIADDVKHLAALRGISAVGIHKALRENSVTRRRTRYVWCEIDDEVEEN